MTREEAIKVLNSYCSERYLADTSLQEACSVAVEALQAQAESEDAISREDVIALVQCSEYELQDRVDNDAMCDDVRKLPSVKPQEKTGHWIMPQQAVEIEDIEPQERSKE